MAGENIKDYIPDPKIAEKIKHLIQSAHSVCNFLDKHKMHMGDCPANEIDPAGGAHAAYCRCGLSELYSELTELRTLIGEDPEGW